MKTARLALLAVLMVGALLIGLALTRCDSLFYNFGMDAVIITRCS